MGGAPLSLRRADDGGLSYVESLLAENGLPSRDVRATPACFYVGYDGADRVGVGGVEVHGSDGLLRSLVVEQSKRGEGYGTALCERLEATAQARGAETLYLLTTTASEFFDHRGYVEIDRSAAPDGIRGTAEFADLCPASAVCMRKLL